MKLDQNVDKGSIVFAYAKEILSHVTLMNGAGGLSQPKGRK